MWGIDRDRLSVGIGLYVAMQRKHEVLAQEMKQSVKVLIPAMVEVEFVCEEGQEPVIRDIIAPTSEAIMQSIYVKTIEKLPMFMQGGVEFGQWAIIHCGSFKLRRVG